MVILVCVSSGLFGASMTMCLAAGLILMMVMIDD
jgi:hypothetical protein